MRASITTWRGACEVELYEALTPAAALAADGVAERAEEKADAALKAIGKLLAYLVETKVLRVDQASELSGNYYTIEIVS